MNGVLDKLMLYSFENGSVTWSVDISFAQDQKCNLSFISQRRDVQLSYLREQTFTSSVDSASSDIEIAVAYQP
jgi:hypothetical protein